MSFVICEPKSMMRMRSCADRGGAPPFCARTESSTVMSGLCEPGTSWGQAQSPCPPRTAPHRGGISLRSSGLRFIFFPQHRYVEAIGAGATRRHQKPLVCHERRVAECSRALTERNCHIHRGNGRKVRITREKATHLVLVLFGQNRAGHISEAAARLHQRRGAIE